MTAIVIIAESLCRDKQSTPSVDVKPEYHLLNHFAGGIEKSYVI